MAAADAFSGGLLAALFTGAVVATGLVAATTATDDRPAMAVATVVSANGGDRGDGLTEWLWN